MIVRYVITRRTTEWNGELGLNGSQILTMGPPLLNPLLAVLKTFNFVHSIPSRSQRPANSPTGILIRQLFFFYLSFFLFLLSFLFASDGHPRPGLLWTLYRALHNSFRLFNNCQDLSSGLSVKVWQGLDLQSSPPRHTWHCQLTKKRYWINNWVQKIKWIDVVAMNVNAWVMEHTSEYEQFEYSWSKKLFEFSWSKACCIKKRKIM